MRSQWRNEQVKNMAFASTAFPFDLFFLFSLLLFASPSISQSNQFCEAKTAYCEAGYVIPSSKLLIKGGTVVNAHHQDFADVYVEDEIIVAVQPNLKVDDDVNVIDATGK